MAWGKMRESKKPDTDVIASLERLLDMAKRGDIHAVAYACVHPGENTSSGWASLYECRVTVIGELSLLQRDVMDTGCLPFINPQTGEPQE
jgi:hypothetical protein